MNQKDEATKASNEHLKDVKVESTKENKVPNPSLKESPNKIESSPSNNYMIMGYNVVFPQGKKPFPAQFAVMNKVLLALKSSQHALLESPTGSGKTLALLCSSLTFQREYFKELQQQHQQQQQQQANAQAATTMVMTTTDSKIPPVKTRKLNHETIDTEVESIDENSQQEDDDFDASQPSFDKFRYKFSNSFLTTKVKSQANNETNDDNNEDGWISMEGKRAKAKDPAGKSQRKRRLPNSFQQISSSIVGSDSLFLPSSRSTNTNTNTNTNLHTNTNTNSNTNSNSNLHTMMPKIFFCSRTHSQLAQVIEELKHCPEEYFILNSKDKDKKEQVQVYPQQYQLKSSVLGSKANYCVNPRVMKTNNNNNNHHHHHSTIRQIDEKCRLLLEEKNGCSFFKKKKSFNILKKFTPNVWDIEEMVDLAKKHHECAFFHARELCIDANIIFCPYNYLLDPIVREAVGINLKNAIVILDEAHNVEDTCRSSASLEMSMDLLHACIKAFTFVLQSTTCRPVKPYSTMLKLLNGLTKWLQFVCTIKNQLKPTGYEEENGIWTGSDFIAILSEYCGINEQNFQFVKQQFKEVMEFEKELLSSTNTNTSNTNTNMSMITTKEIEEQEEIEKHNSSHHLDGKNDPQQLRLSSMAIKSVQQILQVIEYMLRDDKNFLDDFKLIARKSRRKQFKEVSTWEYTICIWCLNAAVAFQDIVQQARSILLTSGTLSPMDSFAGELGCSFPIRLEANHVVNLRQQVSIGYVLSYTNSMKSSSSSSSTSTCSSTISQDLSASYQNQQDFGYQDAMGKLLNDYVKVIPGGILMFFPSYALMLKLVQRWKMTKQWFSIQKTKEIFMEPRQTGKEFDLILEKYKKTILNPITNGAIMLAVYRGKVSEGIDFSNENARAVLAVGIPYPNVKELQVQLKRQYQDTKSQIDRKLVNGTSWYQLQAFRALNQALGRCIRHREDYGVILLIDSRHRQGIHVRHLSKWIRPHVQEFTQASKSVQEVQHFFQRIEKTHFFSKRQQFLAAAATTTTTTTAAAAAITIETNTKPIELKYETTTPTMSTTTIPSSSSPMGMSVNSYMAATAVSKAKARKKNIHNTNAKSQYFSIFQKKN